MKINDRHFVPPSTTFCPPKHDILSPKHDILYQTNSLKNPHKYTFFSQISTRFFECRNLCKTYKNYKTYNGKPPSLDGRGALPYSYRYLQKNKTTKKYQFLFIGKFKKHLNLDLVKNTNNYFLIKIKSQQKKKK